MRVPAWIVAASLAWGGGALAAGVGERAPALALPDLAGRPVRLQDLGERVVVVHFWATWCGPCLEELPRLQALQRDLGDDATILTVSLDTSQRQPELMAARLGLTLPVLRDPTGAAAGAWEPAKLPSTYVVADGRVVEVHAGALDPDGVARLRERIRSAAR